MKLLCSPSEINKVFLTLLQQYSEYYWLSAWGGVSFAAFDEFSKQLHKCRRVVVGTHFFQTHPDFIDAVLNTKGVRFVKRTDELFHPKAYLFFNSKNDWKLLTGSANFTRGAFTSNSEIMMLVDQNSPNSGECLETFFELAEKSWNESETFNQKELERYRIAWKNAKRKRDSLAQNYGVKQGGSKQKQAYDTEIFTMEWRKYMSRLLQFQSQLAPRLQVLEIARSLFTDYSSFSAMPLEARKFIAGIDNRFDVGYEVDWAWFGSMVGAGLYKKSIRLNDVQISLALDAIPLNNQVTKADYDKFVTAYASVFPGRPIATASRLLTMKRPDVFYCLTSLNQKAFCKDFGLVNHHIQLDNYWEMVVERVMDSEWWINPNPKNKLETSIKECRAAFLDVLYYEGK